MRVIEGDTLSHKEPHKNPAPQLLSLAFRRLRSSTAFVLSRLQRFYGRLKHGPPSTRLRMFFLVIRRRPLISARNLTSMVRTPSALRRQSYGGVRPVDWIIRWLGNKGSNFHLQVGLVNMRIQKYANA